jgi:hypothetical protein
MFVADVDLVTLLWSVLQQINVLRRKSRGD